MSQKTDIEPDYTFEDCMKINEIYLSKHKKAQSSFVVTADVASQMIEELGVLYNYYLVRKHRYDDPTQKQLKDKQTKMRNKAKVLFADLQEETDFHFFSSLIAARSGTQSPLQISEEEFDKQLDDIEKNMMALSVCLAWLVKQLDFCISDEFTYHHINKNPEKRFKPETIFIRLLSEFLNKYFKSGGITRSAYGGPSGWRIECLEYLLNQVGISCTREQIANALENGKKTKNQLLSDIDSYK